MSTNINANLTIVSINDDSMWTRIRWATHDVPAKNSPPLVFESGFSYDNREDFYDAVNIEPDDFYTLKGKSFNARVYQKSNNPQWFVDPSSLYDAEALSKLLTKTPAGLTNPVLTPITAPKLAPAPLPAKTKIVSATVAKAAVSKPAVDKSLAAQKGADTKSLLEVRKALVKHFDRDDLIDRRARLSQSDPEIVKAAERLLNLLDSRLFG